MWDDVFVDPDDDVTALDGERLRRNLNCRMSTTWVLGAAIAALVGVDPWKMMAAAAIAAHTRITTVVVAVTVKAYALSVQFLACDLRIGVSV